MIFPNRCPKALRCTPNGKKVYGYVTDQIGTVVEITESNRKDVLGDGSVHFVQTREGGPYGRYGLAGTVTLNNTAGM